MLKDVESQVASSEAQLKGFSFGCGPAQQGCPMCCEYSVIFSDFSKLLKVPPGALIKFATA